MERIPKNSTNRVVFFVAVDTVNLYVREIGLSSFTVNYVLDNGVRGVISGPTTVEIDSTNLPGLYSLAIDEAAMTNMDDANNEETLVLHITHASISPVTMKVAIYREILNTILADVTGLNGAPMRGTDGANTTPMRGTDGANQTIPDAAGTAASLHATTNGKVDALNNVSTAQIIIAMKAMSGITEGGTWTWEKTLKILTAFVSGDWRVKSSNTSIQQLMDAEDGTTVILEQSITRSPAAGAKYRNITVLI